MTPNCTMFWKPLAAIAGVALFSLVAQAQTVSIAGNVVGEDGKPAAGAQIRIERVDIKGTYKVKTDKKGHYIYAGLPLGGNFTVVLEKDGKDIDKVQGVRPRGGDPAEVNFDMSKIAKGQTAAAAEQERGMSAAEKEAFEKQKKANEEAIAKNKALNDAFAAGKEAANAKNWSAAIENFTKATEIDPNQHVVWGNLADAYLARKQPGDVEKGIEAYAKAVAIKGDDPAYHNNYALALAQAKKFDEAQAELTKAAQIDPASAGKYYYNLGAVYVNTGQSEPAGAAFKKAIDADPNYADAYYQMGLVMFGQATTAADGKITPPAGTADMFQKYLQLRPDGANADAAKAMLAALGSTVETSFERPGQKKQPAPAKKK
jgi:tetratricopeptide (TPR) repeat protein